MGAKYLPTTKDLKAAQRFQRQQSQARAVKKPLPTPTATPAKKK